MRKTILTMSFVLTGAVVASSTSSCGGGGAFGGDGGFPEGSAACASGQTQECSGPGGCVGGQLCTASEEWTACSCLNDAGKFEVDGSLIPIDSGSGSGGTDGGGTGGTSGSAG